MAKPRKLHVTSLRLDSFQLEGLRQLKQRQDRSRSWLISHAIDLLLEEELHVSRAEVEAQVKAAYDAELLASFTPKPYVMPADPGAVLKHSGGDPT